jgi:hypothetical protein
VNWFKLVGATEDPVGEDWERTDSDNFIEIRFPWNKPPTQVCLHDRVILYAVGAGVLMAAQRVVGEPGINPRRGPKGSLDDRWPHTIQVETGDYCSPLASAPKLREVAPDFAERYAKRFRNGSHWRIDDSEYEHLALAIKQTGRRYAAPGVSP